MLQEVKYFLALPQQAAQILTDVLSRVSHCGGGQAVMALVAGRSQFRAFPLLTTTLPQLEQESQPDRQADQDQQDSQRSHELWLTTSKVLGEIRSCPIADLDLLASTLKMIL